MCVRIRTEDNLEGVLKKVLKNKDADGAVVLPDYASVEPGALLHKMYEVWKRKENAHSFANLNKWTGRIPSLQHKLKGRLPIKRKDGDAQRLLAAMLEHWSDNDAHPVLCGYLPYVAAERLAAVLFGPIYGIERNEIKMVESPGINTAKFMTKQQQDQAEVIFIPVTDRVLFGHNPITALDGARLSLVGYLGQRSDDQRKKDGGNLLIYALRSDPADAGLDYVRYLYERSYLVTLFRLLQVTSLNKWKMKLYPTDHERIFPVWKTLQRQLWVCVSPSGTRIDDFIPERVPAVWSNLIESFTTESGCGFVVVRMKEKDKLKYWKYRRDNKAFSPIREPETSMVEAHKKLMETVQKIAAGEKSPDICKGWDVMSAQDFMDGQDLLRQPDSAGER